MVSAETRRWIAGPQNRDPNFRSEAKLRFVVGGWTRRMAMFEARTNEWQETCLQGLCELAPDRRMAGLEKLRSILRKENHEFGPLWGDFAESEVKRNGTRVSLTNLEFRLLRYLMERAGCLVSREELLRSVWEYNRQALTRTVDM